jgi:hypothetical protein
LGFKRLRPCNAVLQTWVPFFVKQAVAVRAEEMSEAAPHGDSAPAASADTAGPAPSEPVQGVYALPHIICVFAHSGGGKTTLGRQLAALPGYHVVDEDGGMRVWPGWDAVLPQCVAAGVHTIVVTCHPSMWGTFSLCQELGYSMHTCFLTGRADTYNRLGGMDFPFVRDCTVLLHCGPSSSSDDPTWTVTRGDVPWLASVPQAPSAQVA